MRYFRAVWLIGSSNRRRLCKYILEIQHGHTKGLAKSITVSGNNARVPERQMEVLMEFPDLNLIDVVPN